MSEVTANRQLLESLGAKLDRFADDLTDEEKNVLAAVFELAEQEAVAATELSLSQRLQRVLGPGGSRIDAGTFVVIV